MVTDTQWTPSERVETMAIAMLQLLRRSDLDRNECIDVAVAVTRVIVDHIAKEPERQEKKPNDD